MTIGFDGSRAFSKNRTGTENYSYQILYHLSKLDHTNNYYIYLRPNVSITPPQNQWPRNFKFITIPYPRLWTQVGLARQTFIDKLDVLFIPAHTLPIIHKRGLKTVVTVHDLGAEYLPTTHQLKQRLYLNLMTHHQLKSATHLIAVSQATKADLVKKVRLKPDKISVTYEGFNEELFKPVSDSKIRQTISQYNIKPKEYFLFVGTIQPRKNLERLIKAYAEFLKQQGVARAGVPHRVPAALARTSDGAGERQDPAEPAKLPCLVLAGGKGWLSDSIYHLPAQLGIQDQIKFLGYVPDEKLPALYSGALAFTFPSLFEGFGIPILEAMACGCPVITSRTSSMPEVAGKAAILVNPYQEAEITKALKLIYTDKKLRTKLVKEGFKQITKFSWEKAAQETLRVLTTLS